MPAHEPFMQRALELATRGTGCTSPNPLVGSVVVRDGVIIGEGWHEVYGEAHAEVNAINSALDYLAKNSTPASDATTNTAKLDSAPSTNKKPPLSDATIYVTLEPCNHHGQTPPCSQLVLDSGIRHVVYAVSDPNPNAAGGGQWLAERGVNITSHVLEGEAKYINRFFLTSVAHKRPWIIAKSATSLDGKTATHSGHSQWITGSESRQKGHELRQAVDAIVVGADTVINDDPSLTVRLPDSVCAANTIRHPRPVLLDSAGRIPLNKKLLSKGLPTSSLVITTNKMPDAHKEAIEANGHEVLVVETNKSGSGVSPQAVISTLANKNIQSVLLEGGASVHGSFRDAGLIDEYWTFMAPMIIGGSHAKTAFSASGSNTLDDATRLNDIHIEHLGNDVLIRGCTQSITASVLNTTEQTKRVGENQTHLQP